MNPPTYATYQCHNVHRVPQWRWDRANHLLRTGRRYTPRRDDDATGRAVAYLRRRQYLDADDADECLRRYDPPLHDARLVYEGPSSLSVSLKARLLAGATSQQISEDMRLPVEAIDQFESLFFEVREHLGERDWIVVQAIDWWNFVAAGRNLGQVLLAFAFYSGPVALDLLMPYWLAAHRGAPALSSLPASAVEPDARLDRLIRLALNVEMLPWGGQADKLLLKLALQLPRTAEFDPLIGERGESMDKCIEELEALRIDALPRAPTTGPTATKDSTTTPFRETA